MNISISFRDLVTLVTSVMGRNYNPITTLQPAPDNLFASYYRKHHAMTNHLFKHHLLIMHAQSDAFHTMK